MYFYKKVGDYVCQEIKDARQNAEWKAPKTDSSAFHRAKDIFDNTKSRHESAEAEFKQHKFIMVDFGNGDGLGHGHTVLDQSGNKTYDRGAFEKHGKQNYVDSRYGTFNGNPAKMYPDKRQGHEGWQNILYSDKGDFAPGNDHGHILVNEAGSVINWRDQRQKHGDEYFIDESKDDHTR